jgi:hypothetical protein
VASNPIIYAHRGVWASPEEQNSPQSILKASQLSFGVETDFRSVDGNLVISHEPLNLTAPLLVDKYDFSGLPVALNIKEDGLTRQFSEFLAKFPNEDSFIFDGSVPEMLKIKKAGLPHALRLSEYEKEIFWETRYIWVDAFHKDWWIDSEFIENLLMKHVPVFVSPELHGREKSSGWNYFRKLKYSNNRTFGVCTDFPVALREFLGE